MGDERWPIEQCRGCRAPVYIARVEAGTRRAGTRRAGTRRAGTRVVLVDVERVPARTGTGTVLLIDQGAGKQPTARLITNQADLFAVQWAWRRHLDTCPNAGYFRARAARRARPGSG